MQFKLVCCGQIVGYSDYRDGAEINAAHYSRTVTEFGVDIFGMILGEWRWMARFLDGRCTEIMKGYGPLCPEVLACTR